MPPPQDLRIEYVPLTELERWPRNPKEHDLGALSQSFARFGYVNPILKDETTGRMVAGHGRVDMLLYLKNNGGDPPERIQVRPDDGEWLVPVIRGIAFRDENEAEAYLIADNQLTMLGGWNDSELYEALKRQASIGRLDGTGFDGDDVDDLRRRLEEEAAQQAVTEEPSEPLPFTVYSKDIIIERAFSHFRSIGFPYRRIPLHMQMIELNRLAALGDDPKALKSNLGYLVADTYHPHRFHCHAQDKRSPVESFHDDGQLQRALRLSLDNGVAIPDGYFSMLTLVAGTQACANFRPGIAMHYYRRYGVRGGIVLDPCTGYGGRIVGWMASQLGGEYIGVDPSTETHRGNSDMVNALVELTGGSVSLINAPFEDVDVSALRGLVDFVLTSPPYFAKELYADEPTQSFQRYRTIDEWGTGFLRPMLQACFDVLKPGHFCCINIADVKLRNRTFPLEEMTREAGRAAGFTLHDTELIEFSPHFGKGEQDEDIKTEPMFIFRKPSGRQPVGGGEVDMTGRIREGELNAMFSHAGVDKQVMYAALRRMGRENIRGAQLRAQWSPDNPTRNYCYVIAEFVYNYVAPEGSAVFKLDVPGDLAEHWFVRWPDGALVDLAAEQFDRYYEKIRYERGQRAHFMAPSPSKRARLLAHLCGYEENAPE